ncbi:MAG: T9SS type A sorting domain-containing protein [Candidatus Marinimicrobia bacterium]|nr:T9SS type A sorting domain-containing protein [Candidatus Neomarinimicrobiota bacterium]
MFRHIERILLPIKAVFIAILMVGFFHPVSSIAQEADMNFESVSGTANSSGGQSESFTNARMRGSIGQPLVGRHSGGAIRGFAGLFYRIPQAPRLESIPVRSALEDALYSYQIVASDANGDSILYAVVEGPENMQIDRFGLLLWTPSETDVGMTGVIIAAYDERGDSSFQAWDINVENSNDPPVIILSDTLAIFLEDSSIVIPFGPFISDPDDSLDSLTLSAIIIDDSVTFSELSFGTKEMSESIISPRMNFARWSEKLFIDKADDGRDASIFSNSMSNLSLVIEIDNESKDVTLSGLPDSSGTFTVVFSVSDADDSTSSDTTVIRILPVNDAPVVSGIPDISFPEDSSFSIDLDDFVTDVDNNKSDLNWRVELFISGTQMQANPNRKLSREVMMPVELHELNKPKNKRTEDGNFIKNVVSAELNFNNDKLVKHVKQLIMLEGSSMRTEKRERVEIILESSKLSELRIIIFMTSLIGDTLDSILIHIDSVSHVATLSAPSNYFVSNIPVVFTATDPGNLSDADTILISVEPVNDPPSKFELSYPLGDTLNTLLPSFAWRPSADADPDDRIEYRLMISAFESLESPLFSEILTDTFYTLSVPLADDSLFYWSVMANDSSGQFAFSDTASFLLDKQESPLEFSLISPENNSPVDSLRPLFTWFSSEDPDPRDTVRYSLIIMSAVDSDSVVYLATGLEDTTHQVTEDILPGSYRWFVIAEDADEDSLDTPSVEVFGLGDIVGVEDEEYAGIPEEFSLFQNYPNPFNPTTTIMYALPQRSDVTLEIYNITGKLVARIQQNNLQAGYHEIRWNGVNQSGRSVASGLYIYQLSAGDFVQTKKMLLLK